jgi:hypothetical protein
MNIHNKESPPKKSFPDTPGARVDASPPLPLEYNQEDPKFQLESSFFDFYFEMGISPLTHPLTDPTL